MELAKHLKREHFSGKRSNISNKVSLEAQTGTTKTGLNDHEESVDNKKAPLRDISSNVKSEERKDEYWNWTHENRNVSNVISPSPNGNCSNYGYIAEGTRNLINHAQSFHQNVLKINRESNLNALVKDKVCQYCPYKTANESFLKLHENAVHQKGDCFKCDLCNFATYNISYLKAHKISHIKARSCPICGYKAEEESIIETHLEGAHANMVKKKKCDQCQFSAYHEPILRAHKAEHGGTDCKFCFFIGKSRYGLQRHMIAKHEVDETHNWLQMHSERPTRQCSLCNFSSVSVSDLSKHAKDTHGTPYDNVCDSCGKDFLRKHNLDNHMKSHSEVKDVKCNLCTFETTRITVMINHWKTVHKGVNLELKCHYCDFGVPKLHVYKSNYKQYNGQLAKLETHLKEEHKYVAKIGSCSMCQFTAYHKTTMSVHIKSMHVFKCELCSYEGKSARVLRIHITRAHRHHEMDSCMETNKTCKSCPLSFKSKQSLSIHVVQKHRENKCHKCPFKTVSRRRLNNHLCKDHDIDERILKASSPGMKCSDCDYTTKGTRDLTNHALSFHQKILRINKNPRKNRKSDVGTLVKDKICQYCPYKTAYEHNLRKHERGVHLKGDCLKCDLCGFATYSTDYLKMHKLSHIKARSCPICDYKAEEVSMIETHLHIAHVNQVKKKECDQCQFTAYHEPILREHMAEHGGTDCKLCGYNGKSRGSLQRHMTTKHELAKTHTWKKRQYEQPTKQCSLCIFSSTSVSVLSKHAKDTHGTPYNNVCDLCGKDFSSKYNLDFHMKSHSGVKDVKCNLCTFETTSIQTMSRHWRNIHKGVNLELKCHYCDFEAPKLNVANCNFKQCNGQLTTLETHLKEEHKYVSNIGSCLKCQFTAYHEKTLSAHIKSMHDLKCQLCSYEGKSLVGLRMHISNAHIQKYLSEKKSETKESK